MRKLIVNADDLGLTAGVNRAIVESHSGGVVSSATLMANGAAFADAVTAARSAPNLSVGCHVVLVDGTPVSPPDAVDTLLAIRSAEPDKFYSSLSAFAARAMLGGFDRDQLVAEITAQIRKIQSTGLQVTHLDTHKHAHIFPEILAALLRAARICGVRAIRNPFVPLQSMPARQFKGKPDLWKRFGQVRMLHTFSGPFHQRTKRAGLLTPDGVIGVIETGSVEARWLQFPAAPDTRQPARGNLGVSLPSRVQRRRPAQSRHAIAPVARGGAASADFAGTKAVSGGAKDPDRQLSRICGKVR